MPGLEQALEMQRPPIVRFGVGQIATFAAWVADVGVRRCFVVADRINAARLDVLGLADPGVFGDVKPEPDLPNLEAAVAAAKAMDADAIVGFGGGSAMDLAKLVAVLVSSDKGLRDVSGPNRAPKRSVKLIADPDDGGHRKRGRDPCPDHGPGDHEQDRDGKRRDAGRHRHHRPGADRIGPAHGDGRDRRRRHGPLRRGLHQQALPSDHRRLCAARHPTRRALPQAGRWRMGATSRRVPGWRSQRSTAASASAPSTRRPAMRSPIRSEPGTNWRTASPTR